MKKMVFILAAIPSLLCADNLFKNGDMSQVAGWQGQGLYRDEEGVDVGPTPNAVRLLKAQPRKGVDFSQSIDLAKVKSLKLEFRYKTSDLTGEGFELQYKIPNQYPEMYMPTLVKDGKWHKYQKTFSGFDKADRVEFFFCLLPGSGTVAFDDIVVQAVENPGEAEIKAESR